MSPRRERTSATIPVSEYYLQVKRFMQFGSQHVSSHAGQRTSIVLHARPQTEVKEEFPDLAREMELRLLRSFILVFFSTSKQPPSTLNFSYKEGTWQSLSESRRKRRLVHFGSTFLLIN